MCLVICSDPHDAWEKKELNIITVHWQRREDIRLPTSILPLQCPSCPNRRCLNKERENANFLAEIIKDCYIIDYFTDMNTIFSCDIMHLSHLKGLGTSVLKKWLVTVASTFNFLRSVNRKGYFEDKTTTTNPHTNNKNNNKKQTTTTNKQTNKKIEKQTNRQMKEL